MPGRRLILTTLVLTWLGAGPAWAQLNSLPISPLPPNSAPIATPPSLADTLNASAPAGPNTFASFVDSAIVRSQMRITFDDQMRIRRPMRDEYYMPKNGLLPESDLDLLQLNTYVEVAITPQFSTFLTTPVRMVNPDVNANNWGLGDLDLGLKWAMISNSSLVTTLQFRAYIPTASHLDLGTSHVTLEPALLLNYNLLGCLTLEGEARYWAPIGGSDFAGDIVRYGLSVAYGQQSANDIFLVPVIEGVGWTTLGGKTYVPGPGAFGIESAAGTTIFNLYGGLRLGLGNNMSIYAGYGRALTGPSWYKDVWRLEFRLFF